MRVDAMKIICTLSVWMGAAQKIRKSSCEFAKPRQVVIPNQNAGWSSLVARQAHNLKAAGSNPAPATNFRPCQTAGLFLISIYISATCLRQCCFLKRYLPASSIDNRPTHQPLQSVFDAMAESRIWWQRGRPHSRLSVLNLGEALFRFLDMRN